MAKEIWKKDEKRIADIRNMGYNILEIWSFDVERDHQEVLEKCRSFLYEYLSTTN